jgi:hypothetical protein
MRRKLSGARYQTTSCDAVMGLGIVSILAVSDRFEPVWHDAVAPMQGGIA